MGEQFFIDSVKAAVAALPADKQLQFKDDLAGFVGQEATHRHIHGLFNAQLEAQGYTNTWGPRALRRTQFINTLDPRHRVAITSAFEHYTAVLADWLLSNESQLSNVDQRLRTMWLWHSVEESEHKSVAFDVYQALSGSRAWRARWFLRASVFFSTDLLRQTLRNLAHDGALLRWSTWRSAWTFLLGKDGAVRAIWGPLKAYLAEDFHPTKLDSSPLTTRWLAANGERFRIVGAAA